MWRRRLSNVGVTAERICGGPYPHGVRCREARGQRHEDDGGKDEADGTEHTIKYTDKTAIEGAKDAGGDVKEGAHVSVKYTEEGGEKTAVGVKDLGKEVDK